MTHSEYQDYAEHHYQIKSLLKDYYKARIAHDFETAAVISSMILKEATCLSMVTIQDQLVNKLDQIKSK